MDQEVYIIANGDEYHLGKVSKILECRDQVDRAKILLQIIRESIEEIVFENGDEEDMIFSLELR